MVILSFGLIAYLFLNIYTLNKRLDGVQKLADARLSVMWDLLSNKGLVDQEDLDWAISNIKARMIPREKRDKQIAAIEALLKRNIEKKG